MVKVGIIMGSDSDLPIMKETAEVLEDFEIEYELTVISAHRTPAKAEEYAKTAEDRGLEVIIAGAGKAAHLAGVLAAYTSLPVIGVPIKTSTLGGNDSLYSMVQMPGGVPVATVALNGAKNAGLLAIQILGVANQEIREKFKKYKEKMADKVKETAEELENLGYQEYLNNHS
ncbi:5-(carboxyamino)imidazole ribonucleotide mutase [Selenihalanaerobacter shriftii]|uniref:N5-carboxyaminoimidazole ribonucleotide mutase n=1 Tax=Selenihalanaerobacter shriftii TaxID=142842 RepID=A0A1T4NQN5_9FIRM|nr:5-(carboxyamino)imidazole ribonucleotide mutase [Selenihalanaerobacter shriftii]